MDYILYLFFDYATNPLEIAVRLMLFIIVVDSVFGLVGSLLSNFRK